VDLRLVLGDSIVNLFEEHFDVASRIGDLPNSSIVAIKVGSDRRVVCASPGYLSRFGTQRAPANLSAHRCMIFQGLMSFTSLVF